MTDAFTYAADLPDNYLACRDYGHQWLPYTASWSGELLCWEQTLRCGRCTTTRVRRLARTGAILGGHYAYPDGYLHEHGGRLSTADRDLLRLETLARTSTGNRDELSTRRRRA